MTSSSCAMVISKYNDVKCKPGRRGASFVKGSSGLLLIGALGLGGIADAQSFNFRPYVETGVAAASISEQASFTYVGETKEYLLSLNDTVGMLYLTLGSEIWSFSEEYSVFAEFEVDFFEHYLVGAREIPLKNEILPAFFNLGVKATQNAHFQPYIYGGVGVTHMKDKYQESSKGTAVIIIDEVANKFAWQIGFGFAYNLNKNLALDAGYTFACLGRNKGMTQVYDVKGDLRPELSKKVSMKSKVHEFHLGMTYTF